MDMDAQLVMLKLVPDVVELTIIKFAVVEDGAHVGVGVVALTHTGGVVDADSQTAMDVIDHWLR